MSEWTKDRIQQIQYILSCYPASRYQEALKAIEKKFRRPVSAAALRGLFQRQGLDSPTSYCQEDSEPDLVQELEERLSKQNSNTKAATFEKLVQLTKRNPIPFDTLCDKLDLSPAKAKALIAEAKKAGLHIHVEHDHVGLKLPEATNEVQTVGLPPVIGERQTVAVISDTHLGSKYCLRKQLIDFIHHCYDRGIRDILHPGDVLEGMYRHAVYEVSHVGLDDQTQDLYETLPELPGLTYHCITGNHDFTFTEHSGVDVGNFITNYFRERGRTDIKFYGNRGAFLKVKGIVVHLWHPKSGAGYARSYGIQKQIERYTSLKPAVTLIGHWHTSCYVYERGVHGIACPTFQGGQSAYGKSLGGAPAIGGLILSWDLTAHGTVRNFTYEKRSYFENEKPVDIFNPTDAEPIEID